MFIRSKAAKMIWGHVPPLEVGEAGTVPFTAVDAEDLPVANILTSADAFTAYLNGSEIKNGVTYIGNGTFGEVGTYGVALLTSLHFDYELLVRLDSVTASQQVRAKCPAKTEPLPNGNLLHFQ